MTAISENIGLFPHDLLESAAEDAPDRRWWAVYTKSRQEKVFCQQLRGLRFRTTCRWSRKSPTPGDISFPQVPLFSGYVFMRGEEHERVLSLTTNRISQILTVTDGARLQYDLRQISRLIASGATVTINDGSTGRRVRIRRRTGGPGRDDSGAERRPAVVRGRQPPPARALDRPGGFPFGAD